MNKKPEYDLVLGAAGAKFPVEIGALIAIDELQIPIGTVTGISAGAALATLYKNGIAPTDMPALFLALTKKMGSPASVLRSLVFPNLRQLQVSLSCVSLEHTWRTLIKELGLVTRDDLQILAYDIAHQLPVLFKGTEYDLAKAWAASGTVPGLFAPIVIDDQVLVDGAYYHYNPTEFSQSPAIVIRPGRVTRLPRRLLTPVDAYFHFRELYCPIVPTHNEVDERECVLVHIDCPEIAGLTIGLSDRRFMQMVDDGYHTAKMVLEKAILSKQLIVG